MSVCQSKRCSLALFFFALGIGASVSAAELWVRVKSDRVNLRARPDLNSEVVAQVNTGDRLAVISMRPDWVEIVPPDSVDVWAYREFIKDGMVTVDRLNLRAGPGINFSIVGSVANGQTVTTRGQFGEWVKVAPVNASLWISREFVEPIVYEQQQEMPASPPPVQPVDVPPPVQGARAGTDSATVPQTPPVPSDMRLVPLPGQGRSVRMEGELKPTPFMINRPSAFRLVRKEGVEMITVCYVRGNSSQLNSLLNEHLVIHGREYWVQGVRHPVVLVERIERRAR
jgi:hypothetical protein